MDFDRFPTKVLIHELFIKSDGYKSSETIFFNYSNVQIKGQLLIQFQFK